MGCWKWRVAMNSHQDEVGGGLGVPQLQEGLHHVQQLAKKLGRNTG